MRQLAKRHGHKLLPTAEPLGVALRLVALDWRPADPPGITALIQVAGRAELGSVGTLSLLILNENEPIGANNQPSGPGL
jgi:hypothetical protein